MISVNAIGRIGNDIELQKTKNGKFYARLSLAVRRDEEKTDWFNVVCYNATAENVYKFFKKGDLIGVTGTLFNDVDEEKKVTYTKILMNSFTFCSSKTDGQPKVASKPAKKEEDFDMGDITLDISSDDLPF